MDADLLGVSDIHNTAVIFYLADFDKVGFH